METSKQISADLKSVLLEKHLNFELLNTYKGVPFVCKAILLEVEEGTACFRLSADSPFAWKTAQKTLILSEGLLEPIEANLLFFDRQTNTLRAGNFGYAGSKLSNRKELRVEPEGTIEVYLEADEGQKTASLADLSMRGAGIRAKGDLPASLIQGKELILYLRLPEGEVRLSGKIRNIARSANERRISVEFSGVAPDKTPIIRYIMRRRAEIIAEMRRISLKE